MRRTLATVIAAAFATAFATAAAAQTQSVIRSQADLPPTRYLLAEPASRAFLSDAFLTATVPAMRADAERLLTGARIEDASIRTRLRSGLAAIAMLQGRPADARALIVRERADQTKPQLRAIGMMIPEAMAAGLEATPARRCEATAASVARRLKNADPMVARDEVLLRLSQVETSSPAYHAGTLVGMIDPTVEKQKSISLMDGLLMVIWRNDALHVPPCRAPVAAALRAWANAPANRPVDIWAAREPAAALFAAAAPVTAAVWDTGMDDGLFAGQMAIDPAEPLNGRDDDGNGVADDVHGPTFDYRAKPTPFPLAPLSAFLAPRLGLSMVIDKGQQDLNYGLDTPEARMFAARAREAGVAEQGEDVLASGENGYRGHGTFVASQIADGLSFVLLYNVRLLPSGYEPQPVPISEAEYERFAAAVPSAVARMRAAGVRVVNMSWGFAADEIARGLLEAGLEQEPAKANARAAAIHGRIRAALDTAMRAAPELLFVAAAGNSNQTDSTLGAVPQTLGLANLLVVGATGQSGQPTAFTTYGGGVRLYARGEGAPGRTPGGGTGHWSGTSMAAPNVARAAAQMLAVTPKLTPGALIEG